ncbi:hypothetical protein [Streptomyces sp. NPDC090029]|uniref:hypothetical protein n=1 Tax=Streptomyces sp. NPDC090029 TaxID=3365924 RepID=UPI0038054754
MLDVEEALVADRPGLLLIADKDFTSKEFEVDLAMREIDLLRPSFKQEKKRRGESCGRSRNSPGLRSRNSPDAAVFYLSTDPGPRRMPGSSGLIM